MIRQKLQFLHSILVNWNYPGWSLFPNSILGRKYLKVINAFVNKREHEFRRISVCSFNPDFSLDIGKKGYAIGRATNEVSEIIYELSKLAKTIDGKVLQSTLQRIF
jgi:hypothetical protein